MALQPGVAAHGCDRAIGHGGRAKGAALDLSLHQVAGGTRRVGAGCCTAIGRCPWTGVIAPCRDALHQGMPGRMELDRVDSLPLHIECVQNGRMAVGKTSLREAVGRSQDLAGGGKLARRSCRAFAAYRILQGRIRTKQIVILQRRGLIEHGVRIPRVVHGRHAPE